MIDAVVFRPMEAADYRAFLALMRETPGVVVRDADAPEHALRYLARNPGLSFVAIAGRQLVGGVMAGHDGRRGYLNHLLVHRQLRGQGIARALVEHAIAALDAAGISKSTSVAGASPPPQPQAHFSPKGINSRIDSDTFAIPISLPPSPIPSVKTPLWGASRKTASNFACDALVSMPAILWITPCSFMPPRSIAIQAAGENS